MSTSTLNKAKRNKQDEFYTQLSDIEKELQHYKKHFKGSVVYCNCDDPYESNFFRYFAMNFNFSETQEVDYDQLRWLSQAGTTLSLFDIEYIEETPGDAKQPYKVEITEVTDENSDGAIDFTDVEHLIKNKKNTLTLLDGDGDFRSPECVKLLEKADIVVTNPPFSLFREYVAQLTKYKKKFIIIGSINAIIYKEMFPLIKDNKIWLGNRSFAGGMWFYITDSNDDYDRVVGDKKLKNVPAIWFTNLDPQKRPEDLTLYKRYTPEEYPQYVNYDAIEISKTAEIPYDYDGEMGVPITFLDKHNPDQFELIGSSSFLGNRCLGLHIKGTYEQGGAKFYLPNGDGTYRRLYERIVIKRKGTTP